MAPVLRVASRLLDITKPVILEDAAQPAVVPALPQVAARCSGRRHDRRQAEDEPAYASLAAAVAAQSIPTDASAELACLAGAIFYESKGEPLAGQLAVAEVIINRTKSGRFPKSICGVVTQRGQFSFVRGGRIPAINPSRSDYRTARGGRPGRARRCLGQSGVERDVSSTPATSRRAGAAHASPRSATTSFYR